MYFTALFYAMKLPAGLKRRIKRTIIFLLSLALVAVLVITLMQYGGDIFSKKHFPEVIIDSDTYYNPDANLAVLRLLLDKNTNILAINAAQNRFINDSGDSSMWLSHTMNKKMISIFNLNNISVLPGEKDMLIKINSQEKLSPAAEFIIKNAKNRKSGEKLSIVSFGPLTNIAAAIKKDSGIAENISLYCVAMHYDAKGKIWNKNEFNARSDLDALDLLLNNQDLDIYFLPVNISQTIELTKRETDKYLLGGSSVETYLKAYADSLFYEKNNVSIPSLALVEIILNQDFVKKEQVLPPPENKKHFVYVYSKINTEMIKADFWSVVLKYFRSNRKNQE